MRGLSVSSEYEEGQSYSLSTQCALLTDGSRRTPLTRNVYLTEIDHGASHLDWHSLFWSLERAGLPYDWISER